MKYYILRETIKKPYFTPFELKLKGFKVFPYQLSFWIRKGRIGKIKRSLYYFTSEKEKISGEEVSFLLYGPSYISLESALSHYGFIPDLVQVETAVTAKTTRTFSNDFGRFIYRHIKKDLFFGYVSIETENAKYLLAEPEKAILDYFYLNLGQINNQTDLDELRINYTEVKKRINPAKIKRYLKAFQINKLAEIIKLILKNVNSGTN